MYEPLVKSCIKCFIENIFGMNFIKKIMLKYIKFINFKEF